MSTASTQLERTRPAAMVLVTHHVEEIPAGFTNALALRAGRIVASGAIEQVISGETLTHTFDQPIAVDRRNGRVWAHLAEPRAGADRLGTDTQASHDAPMITR